MSFDKPSKIKNKHYKEFLTQGIISTINKEQLETVLNNIEYKYRAQAINLVVVLYHTGCRPKEALKLKGKDFTKEGRYIKIKIPAVKRGVTRTVFLNTKDQRIKDLFSWTQKTYPEVLLFWGLISDKKRTNIRATLKDGSIKTYDTVYHDTTNKLRHWFLKWFSVLDSVDSYTPYFLRHNHFSRLSEHGASMEDIMHIKGARSIESVRPYLHMSTKKAKKIANIKMD